LAPISFYVLAGHADHVLYGAAGIAENGDEVLVGDPMYATYEGVIRPAGPKCGAGAAAGRNGFRMRAADVAARSPRAAACCS
jgi:arginine:pyruvate transaminase